MAKYFYSDEDEDTAFEFESHHTEENPDWIAEAAAEDYHDNHDGWEANWPLILTIWADDKRLLGKFEVERETTPVFSACSV
jgi:hypothetical protein